MGHSCRNYDPNEVIYDYMGYGIVIENPTEEMRLHNKLLRSYEFDDKHDFDRRIPESCFIIMEKVDAECTADGPGEVVPW